MIEVLEEEDYDTEAIEYFKETLEYKKNQGTRCTTRNYIIANMVVGTIGFVFCTTYLLINKYILINKYVTPNNFTYSPITMPPLNFH